MPAEYYRGQGWQVEHVGAGAGRSRFDGGVDLKLRKSDEYVLVQAKHWNAKQVTHNAVHELLGIRFNENATGAIVVTSGEFTLTIRRPQPTEPRLTHWRWPVSMIGAVPLRISAWR